MFKSRLTFKVKPEVHKLRGNSHKSLVIFAAISAWFYLRMHCCHFWWLNGCFSSSTHLFLVFLRWAHKMKSTENCQNTVRSGRSSSEASPARLRSGWANPKSWYEVFWQKKIGWCLMQLPPHFMLFSTVWQFIYSIYLALLWLCGVARLDFFPQSFSRLSCICLCQSSGAWRILEIVFLTSF